MVFGSFFLAVEESIAVQCGLGDHVLNPDVEPWVWQNVSYFLAL